MSGMRLCKGEASLQGNTKLCAEEVSSVKLDWFGLNCLRIEHSLSLCFTTMLEKH